MRDHSIDKAVRVLLHLAQQREILSIAVIVIAGDRRRIAVIGDPAQLLPHSHQSQFLLSPSTW